MSHIEEIDLDEEEAESAICPACNGSGEGMYDGSTCRTCGGSGNDCMPWGSARMRMHDDEGPEYDPDDEMDREVDW